MDTMTGVLLIETIAVTLIGSLLHFTYGWSRGNKFVAIFSAVNESTWEHVKLALSGLFACTLVDVWFLGDNPNYWAARSLSFLVPITVIPTIFYTYTTFTRKPILVVDISTFLVAAFLSSWLFTTILEMRPVNESGEIISLITSLVVLVFYLLLTRFPLHKNLLFRDPVTGGYGYEKVHRKQKRASRAKQ